MKRLYTIRFSETVNYLVTVEADGPQTAIDDARRQFCHGELREESACLTHSIISETAKADGGRA